MTIKIELIPEEERRARKSGRLGQHAEQGQSLLAAARGQSKDRHCRLLQEGDSRARTDMSSACPITRRQAPAEFR